MTLVVDASVAVKWIVTEEGSAEAVGLRGMPLSAPDLIVAEVGNVLWRKVRRRELLAEEALAAVAVFTHVDLVLHSSHPLIEEAVQIAIELGHPVYDCLYLALARRLGTQLVTADARLVGRLAAARPELRDLARPLRGPHPKRGPVP